MIDQLSGRQFAVPLNIEKLPAQLHRRALFKHHWRRGGRHMPTGLVLLSCVLSCIWCAGRRVLAGLVTRLMTVGAARCKNAVAIQAAPQIGVRFTGVSA